MSAQFISQTVSGDLHLKLWRGERMCLLGMNVDKPSDDFVGFAIEVKAPGSSSFVPLNNRLAFSYSKPVGQAVTGARWYSSLEAPFQKFRWIDFPNDPKGGQYGYRVTEMHMRRDNQLVKGTSATTSITLDPVIYDGFLDVGFTRNFASSQAYADRYKNNQNIIPVDADTGLKFKKQTGTDVYQWLGFEAHELIFNILKEVEDNPHLSLDVFAYDLNEPDIVGAFERLKGRLRIVIDNSGSHRPTTSAESQAAQRLAESAGARNVKRMHFIKLQHNKVFIVKSGGAVQKVLFGSTNFSFRGIYIQANNALVVYDPKTAQLFEKVFALAFENAGTPKPQSWFETNAISKQWFDASEPGKPSLKFCFSPHANSNLSMNPVGKAISSAQSSVFFSIAFLNQIKSGPVRSGINKLMKSRVFSYGISDKAGGLEVYKPDKSIGLVHFAYLAKVAPKPFDKEWSGGKGIHEHDKFVVTDFNLPTAQVFTGSSNLSPSGEEGNGDNLVLIQDQKVATSYAIEALRVFDHLHFRVRMQTALSGKKGNASSGKATKRKLEELTLQKPTKFSGKPAWFNDFYESGSQAESDRLLFSK
jgi:phosphatidylserine/phosphatidylglycerophosphate/cardiolipin synthase-like enzyme